MDDRSELLAQFTGITGADEGPALQYLEATDWRLEEALQFFFANNEHDNEPAAPANVPIANAPIAPPPGFEPDVFDAGPPYARLSGAHEDEEEVRPPLPVTREALYDNVYAQRAAMQGAQLPPGPPSLNPFRDFQAELDARAHPVAPVAPAAPPIHGSRSLDHMYQPPYDIIYHGTFEQAKTFAQQQKRWLLINVQNDLEFATHQLNSLTWSQEAVKETISQNFVFWQVDINNEDGQKVRTYYHLELAPVIMVLDPRTGAKKKMWEGMVDSQRLLEDLVPFMDKGPMDDRPPHPILSASASKQVKEDEGPPPVADGGTSGGFADEDDELQRALAASMETYQASDGGEERWGEQLAGSSGGAAAVASAEASAPVPAKKVEIPPLPAEPSTSDPGACRVGIRFPDGSRTMRFFLKSDPLEYLRRYCMGHIPEAAEGRQFRLSLPMPGALSLDLSSGSTIDRAGVADAMLAFTWE